MGWAGKPRLGGFALRLRLVSCALGGQIHIELGPAPGCVSEQAVGAFLLNAGVVRIEHGRAKRGWDAPVAISGFFQLAIRAFRPRHERSAQQARLKWQEWVEG